MTLEEIIATKHDDKSYDQLYYEDQINYYIEGKECTLKDTSKKILDILGNDIRYEDMMLVVFIEMINEKLTK